MPYRDVGRQPMSADVDPADRVAGRMVHCDQSTVGDGARGVLHLRFDDGGLPRAHHPGRSIDGDLQFAGDHVEHLFLQVAVRLYVSTGVDLVIRERHVSRMEEPPVPAGPRLAYGKVVRVDERHRDRLRSAGMTIRAVVFDIGGVLEYT